MKRSNISTTCKEKKRAAMPKDHLKPNYERKRDKTEQKNCGPMWQGNEISFGWLEKINCHPKDQLRN